MKLLGSAVFLGGVAWLLNYQFMLLPLMCDADAQPHFCQLAKLHYSLFWGLYSAIIGLAGLRLIWHWRTGVGTLLAAAIAIYVIKDLQIESLYRLMDSRSFGYETFIISFYFWLALLVWLFLLAMAHRPLRRSAMWITGLSGLCMIALFAITGRGAVEHIYPLFGGLPGGFSWEHVWQSILLRTGILGLAAASLTALLTFAWQWVKTGAAEKESVICPLVTGLVLICLMQLAQLSYPVGMIFHARDVASAKEFIDALVPEVEAIRDETGQYPMEISELLQGREEPRLIASFTYMSDHVPGAYYFSRAEKYCFIFQDPGMEVGYHTLTGERGWRKDVSNRPLSEMFRSLCDEKDQDSESLVAGQLGLYGKDDPVARLGAEVDGIEKRASTPTVAGALKGRMSELGAMDPSIYGEEEAPTAEQFPGDMNQLKFMLDSNQRRQDAAEADRLTLEAQLSQLDLLQDAINQTPEASLDEAALEARRKLQQAIDTQRQSIKSQLKALAEESETSLP